MLYTIANILKMHHIIYKVYPNVIAIDPSEIPKVVTAIEHLGFTGGIGGKEFSYRLLANRSYSMVMHKGPCRLSFLSCTSVNVVLLMDASKAGFSDFKALNLPSNRVVLNEQKMIDEIYFFELKLLHHQSTAAIDILLSRGFKNEVSWSYTNALFKKCKGYSVHFGRSMLTNCYEYLVKATKI